MVLRVGIEEFPSAVKRYLAEPLAYLRRKGKGTEVSAGNPAQNLIIVSRSSEELEATSSSLSSKGLECREGSWVAEEAVETPEESHAFIAAVAYRSREQMPGVWIDAFPFPPHQADVLQAMYEEFIENAEIKDVPFEDFVQMAKPNVVIVSPEEVAGYLKRKERDC
ncbi:MAG TPA: hypothetical protein VEX38_00170 [Fimbriimonadaceae bacterium]|nr:hypothetical protein [Fimbriimonadaceae bacterium]